MKFDQKYLVNVPLKSDHIKQLRILTAGYIKQLLLYFNFGYTPHQNELANNWGDCLPLKV